MEENYSEEYAHLVNLVIERVKKHHKGFFDKDTTESYEVYCLNRLMLHHIYLLKYIDNLVYTPTKAHMELETYHMNSIQQIKYLMDVLRRAKSRDQFNKCINAHEE